MVVFDFLRSTLTQLSLLEEVLLSEEDLRNEDGIDIEEIKQEILEVGK